MCVFQEPQPESEIEIVTPLLEEQHEEVEVQQQVQQALVVQYVYTAQYSPFATGLCMSLPQMSVHMLTLNHTVPLCNACVPCTLCGSVCCPHS